MSIHAPLLQHVQWDDEVFPRQSQLDLFELFPAEDRQLHARTGEHALTRPDDETACREHLAVHLNRY